MNLEEIHYENYGVWRSLDFLCFYLAKICYRNMMDAQMY
jgi:hypothetical protein